MNVDGEHHRIPIVSCGHLLFLQFWYVNRSYYKPRTLYNPLVNNEVYRISSKAPNASIYDNLYNLDNRTTGSGIESAEFVCRLKRNGMQKYDSANLKKLNLVLKHGKATTMKDWLEAAGVWRAELALFIKGLLLECPCKVIRELLPHPIVSSNIPEPHKQTEDSLDVDFLESASVMHAVDK